MTTITSQMTPRRISGKLAAAFGIATLLSSTATLTAEDTVPLISLSKISTFQKGNPSDIFDESAAEIVKYHADSQRLFIVNAQDKSIDIVDIQDVNNPTLFLSIDLSSMGTPNSVDVCPAPKSNEIAIAVANDDPTQRGLVAFYTTNGQLIRTVEAGFLPDMVTYGPRGRYVLTANEGEPNDDYTVDPEGSITIIRRHGRGCTAKEVRFNELTAEQLEGVRITGRAGVTLTPAQDIEPEFISVDPKGRFAYVTLQENNAVAKIDIQRAQIADMLPLGSIDHSKYGFELDASNKDNSIRIANWPVNGLPMPDAIATYQVKGETYFVTANEGDGREREVEIDGEDVLIYSDETRVKDVTLDPLAFPLAPSLQLQENLGRLKMVATEGNLDEDAEYEELFSFGTRSFSIYDSKGKLVFDSGSEFEQIIADQFPADFGSTNDENGSFDDRSDDKGPEPEAVELGKIDGRTYAFIGLERIGGIMIYDITDPNTPCYIDYINNRDFSGDAELGTAGDLGPEGIKFIPAGDSPNGKNLLVVANEVSGTTTIFEIVPGS